MEVIAALWLAIFFAELIAAVALCSQALRLGRKFEAHIRAVPRLGFSVRSAEPQRQEGDRTRET